MNKNLIFEMSTKGVDLEDVAKVLGCSVQKAIRKVFGLEELYATEMYYIKEIFFSNKTYDYLFAREV